LGSLDGFFGTGTPLQGSSKDKESTQLVSKIKGGGVCFISMSLMMLRTWLGALPGLSKT